MGDLLIRKIDEEMKRKLAVRAAENGRSMQAEALLILTRALDFEETRRVPPGFALDGSRGQTAGAPPVGKPAKSGFGILAQKADPSKIPLERDAWLQTAVEKELARAREPVAAAPCALASTGAAHRHRARGRAGGAEGPHGG